MLGRGDAGLSFFNDELISRRGIQFSLAIAYQKKMLLSFLGQSSSLSSLLIPNQLVKVFLSVGASLST